jgi:rhamnosyltransferase
MKNSKVVILLAAFNGEKYIAEQIKSLLSQDLKPHKILISIDYSSDSTYSIVKKYSTKYSEIKIVSFNRKFGSAASNFFYLINQINLNDCDFIALCDQDDIWNSNKLARAIKCLNNGYDAYSSNVEAFWESGKRKVIYKSQSQKIFDYLFESSGPGCTFVFNVSLCAQLKKFLLSPNFTKNIDHYHDWLIYAFSRSHKYSWYIDSFVGLNYRQHPNNVFGVNLGIKAFLSRARKVLHGEGIYYSFFLIHTLDLRNSFFNNIYPPSRLGMIRLAFRASSCRRRFIDQFYFFLACMLLSIFFPKKLHDFNLT